MHFLSALRMRWGLDLEHLLSDSEINTQKDKKILFSNDIQVFYFQLVG
jgi:hypothetical protein